jgi:hypothetical protein
MKRSILALSLGLACMLAIGALVASSQEQQPAKKQYANDAEAELDMLRQISRDPDVKVAPRFLKYPDQKRAVPNRWRVEFDFTIENDRISEESLDSIAAQTGARIIHKINHEFSKGGWIECDTDTAERISQMPRVRRVTQDFHLQITIPTIVDGKPISNNGGGGGIRWPLDDRTEGISSAELIEARKKIEPRRPNTR